MQYKRITHTKNFLAITQSDDVSLISTNASGLTLQYVEGADLVINGVPVQDKLNSVFNPSSCIIQDIIKFCIKWFVYVILLSVW